MFRTLAVAAVVAASLGLAGRADAQVVISPGGATWSGGSTWPSGVYWNNGNSYFPGMVYPAGYTSGYFPGYTTNPSISFGGANGVTLSSSYINPNLGATNFYTPYATSYYNPYYGGTMYTTRGFRGRGWRW